MGELWRRILFLLNRSRLERELRDEMEAHRAMKGEAGPRFGNTLRLREESSDVWGWAWLDRVRQDLRFAVRLLVRAPLFTLTAVSVLALGVGINLAAFQVFDAVAFTPLPVPGADRLVKIERRNPQGHSTSFSYPAFAFYREKAQTFSSTFAFVYGSVTLGDDEARHVRAEFVSGNYFTDLGARPLAGRLLDSADERADAPAVVVIGERFWRTRLDANPAIVGGSLRVNGRPFTVAGIVPETFVGLRDDSTNAWVPVTQHKIAFEGSRVLEDWDDKGAVRFFARLKEGVSLTAAEAQLAALPGALGQIRAGEVPEGEWLDLIPAGHYMALEAGNVAALALIGALVLLVLVAACMNLGLLVLSRALGRDREFSIRLSVGATRGLIVRQLFTEHLVLGVLGATVGSFVAAVSTRVLAVAIDMPAGLTPHFNGRTALVAAGLAVLSAFLFGLTPALQTARPSLARHSRLRSILIGVQVAAASVLLIVSGLIVRGVTRIVRVPLGFEYQRTLSMDPDLFSHGNKPEVAQAYWRTLDARVRAVPGVANTAITSLPPFGNRVSTNAEGTVFYHVTPSYFDTMGIPLLKGRIFDGRERDVAIVSDALARRRWPGQDAIGQTFSDLKVIGVVGNARTVRIGDVSSTECYQPITPTEMPWSVMVVRAAGSPAGLSRTLGSLAQDVDRSLSPTVAVLSDELDRRIEAPRQFAMVASTLGVCALLLAVIGLGGMVAFTVSQRLREIGLRVALGARPSHVLRAMARQFAWPVGAGAAAGSALAAAVGTVMSRELFGISQFDPVAHGVSLLLFVSVAVLAAIPSLRRALRVDPAQTLRHE